MRIPLLAFAAALAGCSFTPSGLAVDAADESPDAATEDAPAPTDAGADAAIDAAIDGPTCVPATETCNNTDDDCDTMVDEDFDLTTDHDNCGACGAGCADTNASNACVASVCVPACAAGALDCDLDPTNGCELRDDNPTCTAVAAAPDLAVSGDVGTDTMTVTGFGERYLRVRISEDDTGTSRYLSARFQLTSAIGDDFDLYVRCATCTGMTTSSTNPPGTLDVVDIRRNDNGSDRTFDVLVEVRYDSVTTCTPWSLTVTGNTLATDVTCP